MGESSIITKNRKFSMIIRLSPGFISDMIILNNFIYLNHLKKIKRKTNIFLEPLLFFVNCDDLSGFRRRLEPITTKFWSADHALRTENLFSWPRRSRSDCLITTVVKSSKWPIWTVLVRKVEFGGGQIYLVRAVWRSNLTHFCLKKLFTNES